MKVLHVAQPVDGGVARVVETFAVDQSRRGWEPTVACPPTGELPDNLARRGVSTRSWPAQRSPVRNVLSEISALTTIVRETDPDVIHLHGSKAGLVGRLAVRGSRPTLFQPHLWSFESEPGPTVRPARYWERVAARWTECVVCVSEDEHLAGIRASVRCRYTVIHNGIDTDVVRPRDRGEVRRELGLPDDGPIAVCVARLAPLKGQDMLLDAWPSVLAASPSAHLVLVGDGPLREQLQDEHPMGKHPSVLWMGWSDRATDFFAAADVVVVPSRAEGMAIVPLEAMATGRSVVAFDAGGIRDSVGDVGAVLPIGDISGLSSEISRRLADPEFTAVEGERARKRAVVLFDHRRASDAAAELVVSVASTRR